MTAPDHRLIGSKDLLHRRGIHTCLTGAFSGVGSPLSPAIVELTAGSRLAILSQKPAPTSPLGAGQLPILVLRKAILM